MNIDYKYDKGWLVVDKINDFLYFRDRYEMAKYFDLSVDVISGIIAFCKSRICYYHPKHKLYIQRLYTDYLCKRTPNNVEWNIDKKNMYLIDWIKIKGGHTANKILYINKIYL